MHGRKPLTKEIDGQIFKQCNTCGEFKLLSEYYENKRYYLNCQHECKVCSSAYYKKRNTKDKNRENHLKKYNLTQEEYEVLYKIQGGRCAICFEEFELLHIDHDHFTQRVRGLLCNPCNNGLGLFADDIHRLKNAVFYLERRMT